jgi:hypothetical protein
MSAWQRVTRAEAEAQLEAALDHAADEAHQHLVELGFDEDDQHAGMQRIYACLDEARQRSIASIDRAFMRVKSSH